MPDGLTDIAVELKSKGLSNENFKPSIPLNHSLSPNQKWMNNSRTKIESKGSCLKQDKTTFTPRYAENLFIVYKLDRW